MYQEHSQISDLKETESQKHVRKNIKSFSLKTQRNETKLYPKKHKTTAKVSR